MVIKQISSDLSVSYIEPDNKPDWVYQVSPQDMTPFLLVNGKPLFESAAMNKFVNDAKKRRSASRRSVPESTKSHVD